MVSQPPSASLPAYIQDVPLGVLTTMRVGGPAQWMARPTSSIEAQRAIRFGRETDLPISVLGGGTNVVVADEGVPGLTLRPDIRHRSISRSEKGPILTLGAGLAWSDAVAMSLALEAPNLAHLAAIPGCIGAAPIQNIGAYGTELALSLLDVSVLCLRLGVALTLPREVLGLGYRSSHFKKSWKNRYLITQIRLQLGPENALERVRHPEVRAELAGAILAKPSEVARAVKIVRRRKSMVLDSEDANTWGCGSFFANPILHSDLARVLLAKHPSMPAWATPDGVKLSAAWLIEQSGFARGWSDGKVGLSQKHTLALINLGAARARDVIDAAIHLQRVVEAKFGIRLCPEVMPLGQFGREQATQIGLLWPTAQVEALP